MNRAIASCAGSSGHSEYSLRPREVHNRASVTIAVAAPAPITQLRRSLIVRIPISRRPSGGAPLRSTTRRHGSSSTRDPITSRSVSGGTGSGRRSGTCERSAAIAYRLVALVRCLRRGPLLLARRGSGRALARRGTSCALLRSWRGRRYRSSACSGETLGLQFLGCSYGDLGERTTGTSAGEPVIVYRRMTIGEVRHGE